MSILFALCLAANTAWAQTPYTSEAALGEALFKDVNLSLNRTQACATCHVPEAAFIDIRPNATDRAVSLGDDGTSLGTRNTPTLSYVAQTPAFHTLPDDSFSGGFFYDGRAPSLKEQAKIPLTSPIEMGLSSNLLVHRIAENPAYVSALSRLFGEQVPSDSEALLDAVAACLAAFQNSRPFKPFDSKYDRSLRGEYMLTAQEERGRLLFFSSLINCNSCHLLDQPQQETFTDYSYHNIGVPANAALDTPADLGLADNPSVKDPATRGKFKVPTLRNVAVTAPYMHNGVFKDLRTVLEFYNKFIMRVPLNPETQAPWRPPEVEENQSLDLLKLGQPMNAERMDDIIAFMRTLTDQRYEVLLN